MIEIIQRYYSSIFQIIVSLSLSFVFPITQKETLLSVLFQVSEPFTVKIWFLLPARKEVSVDVEGRYIHNYSLQLMKALYYFSHLSRSYSPGYRKYHGRNRSRSPFSNRKRHDGNRVSKHTWQFVYIYAFLWQFCLPLKDYFYHGQLFINVKFVALEEYC